MPARPRIGVAGFMHETNTFSPHPTDLVHFERPGAFPHMKRGEAMLQRPIGSTAGAVDVFLDSGAEIVPLLWCYAQPSGTVTRAAFETITDWLVEDIVRAGRLDGLQLELHGAMVAEHIENTEFELVSRIQRVGRLVPIAVTLDLHANTSSALIQAVDCMDAYRTYPHIDQRETGSRAARALLEILATGEPFARAERRLDFLIPTPWQCTTIEPAQSIYRRLAELTAADVRLLAFTPGFNAADVPWAGPAIFGYGRNATDVDQAVALLHDLAQDSEPLFDGKVYSASDAVRKALERASGDGPVIIADAEDNPGGGAAGDTTTILTELVKQGANDAVLALLSDPAAVAMAQLSGVGSRVHLQLGGKTDGKSFDATFVVEQIASGAIAASGPMSEGGSVDIGTYVVLRVDGVRVLVSTSPVQIMDRCILERVGINPALQRILVLKSIAHFRAHFEPLAAEIIVAAASGLMAIDPRKLPFQRINKKMRLMPGVPAMSHVE